MTQSDINTILRRLDVLDEKLVAPLLAIEDHARRLRFLERVVWGGVGFAAAAGAGVAKLTGLA